MERKKVVIFWLRANLYSNIELNDTDIKRISGAINIRGYSDVVDDVVTNIDVATFIAGSTSSECY